MNDGDNLENILGLILGNILNGGGYSNYVGDIWENVRGDVSKILGYYKNHIGDTFGNSTDGVRVCSMKKTLGMLWKMWGCLFVFLQSTLFKFAHIFFCVCIIYYDIILCKSYQFYARMSPSFSRLRITYSKCFVQSARPGFRSSQFCPV